MKILVGMSGGVDSSVAALLLKEQGHEVIGATMAIWNEKNKTRGGNKNACYGPDEKEDIEEARRICKEIGILFYVFDCVEQYEKIVLENFKEEYLSGRTPNPCIWCNSLVKFGVLPYLAKQEGIEFEKFATGHYARVEFDEGNGKYLLKKGINPKKDQSYFIYRLKQGQLKNILLPLGGYTKEQIREIAARYGLTVAQKPDSQDFYSGDYNELLEIQEKAGNIVDKDGKVLGQHSGIWNFTIGQRKGIGVSSAKPLYVYELRKETNEVVVGFEDETFKKSLIAKNLSWISGEIPDFEMNIRAKIRSAQAETDVSVVLIGDDEIRADFTEPQKAPSPGQSIVFYDNDIVLGGGIIEKVL